MKVTPRFSSGRYLTGLQALLLHQELYYVPSWGLEAPLSITATKTIKIKLNILIFGVKSTVS